MARLNVNRVRLQERRRMLKFERKYSSRIYNALENSISPVLKNPDADIDERALNNVFVQMYEEVGIDFAKSNYRFMDSLKKAEMSFFLDSWASWIRNFALTELASKVTEINNTTRDKIRKVIADSLDEGITVRSEIAKKIREKTLGAVGRRRSRMIARTEIANAGNEGKKRSAQDWSEESGQQLYKLWIAGGSKENRETHLDVDDGIPIPVDSQWNVGGEMMDRPHDPSASAENVINCSCVVVYVNESYV